jgi:uncharacterized OB-fold protein
MSEKDRADLFEVPWRLRVDYLFSYGEVSRFFREVVENKRLLATRCTGCRKVIMPPRGDCPHCWTPTEWIPLSGKGTVISCTYCFQAGMAEVAQYLDLPIIFSIIKLDGADTYMYHVVDAKCKTIGSVKPGTRVKAVFRDERKGTIADFYFVPEGD